MVLMAKIYIETYGCTLNQSDSDILKALLADRHTLTESEENSDVIIINTCTVKEATENRIMARIRGIHQKGRKLVIAGCLSVNEHKIRRNAPLSPIVAPSSLDRILDAIGDALAGRVTTYKTPADKANLPRLLGAPIARIPISEGCTSACFFCQTKFARPYLRSYSPKTIVRWINEAVKAGAKEIQLTSTDSGAYGIDLKTNLVSLMELIANDDSSTRAGGEFFVRLGMINPDHAMRMLPGIIRMLKHPRFYKFLHIPVQTGSEKVCREMNRDHTVKNFVDIVEAVRKEIPDIAISTDIIVGYPTESEDDYRQTIEMLEQVRPDVTNVSKFSPRPGTKAKELKVLHSSIVKKRSEEASALVHKISEESRKRFIGRTSRVLVTEKQRDFKARDVNYRQVVIKRFKGKLGDMVNVRIADANRGSFFGEQE